MNNKKNNSKLYIIIAGIIVAILVFVFAIKKYNNMPDKNPNNPVANVNFTWTKNTMGDDILLSPQTTGAIEKNLMIIMLKKADNNSEALKYLETHHFKKFQAFFKLRDSVFSEDDLDEDDDENYFDEEYDDRFDGVVDSHFEELLKNDDKAAEVMEELHNMLKRKDEFNTWIAIEPSKHLKKGETVQVKANLPEDLVQEYDIDTAPRKVKVQVK